jgi:hypothetical protein
MMIKHHIRRGWFVTVAASLLAVSLGATPGADAARASRSAKHPDPTALSSFGRMFELLPGYTAPSVQNLSDLAQTQLDAGAAALDNPGMTAGYTYFGQFIDHDLTRDQSASPEAPVDPTTLKNFRTPRFDLDSVYGGGPAVNPELYDGAKLKLQAPNANGVPDLIRRADGTAIIGDNRNDDNLIIAQIQVAAIKFHNRLVSEGASFADAQRLTRWHYQWVVVHDFLPHVVGQARVDRFLKGTTVRGGYYAAGNPANPMTPIEFAGAVYRFGHSQVRNGYRLNPQTFSLVFSETQPDLRGSRDIPATHQIDWNNFFQVHGSAPFAGNLSRKIDTKVSASLFALPIPQAIGGGSNVLAFRNLVRGTFYGLPSGQAISNEMGIRPLTNAQIGLGPEYQGETPLWYYVLAEAEQRENGARLGEVGGRIVAEVFLRQLKVDKNSYLNAKPAWAPTVPHTGAFDISEFLKFAGVVQAQP